MNKKKLIVDSRLQEMVEAPREAYIAKAEMADLALAYQAYLPGARLQHSSDGVWLHIEAPRGKKCCFALDAIGIERGGLSGNTLLEWVDWIMEKQ